MVKRVKLDKNHKLFLKAKRHLVGGVNSPVRSFAYVGGEPLLIKKGKGVCVYDYDNRMYIDYVLSWGALILGHSDYSVLKAVKKAAAQGLSFGTTNNSEVELAKLIKEAITFVDKVRFTNSGTEAVMGAVRLARGFTKRDKIIKFEHSYHGHADYLLVKSGSGLATLGIPSSAGVPKSFTEQTLIAKSGDKEGIIKLFREYDKEIAAVLVEPVGGNFGVIPPDRDFLQFLRKLTRKYKALLIFDEVITGFRFNFGALAKEFGITPDLICLGKIIAGGLPIGAYAGRKEIMDHLAPLGKIYQASTFSGNPVVMQAGLATLRKLKNNIAGYRKTKELTELLVSNIRKISSRNNIALDAVGYANMFSLKFRKQNLFSKFYRILLENGIYLAPSEYEANFISFAHARGDILRTLGVIRFALNQLKEIEEEK